MSVGDTISKSTLRPASRTFVTTSRFVPEILTMVPIGPRRGLMPVMFGVVGGVVTVKLVVT